MNVGTIYNANAGTMEQLKMPIMEQCNNLQWECIPEEGRRRVSGKYGVGRANDAGRDLLDWC